MKNHLKRAISILLIAVMLLTLAACGGKTTFTVITVDLEGNETTFTIKTDAATVGEALEAEGILEGHDAEYGLYIDAVNGIELDWDRDGKYWAFYINGEYALTVVEKTPIEEGVSYMLKVEKG